MKSRPIDRSEFLGLLWQGLEGWACVTHGVSPRADPRSGAYRHEYMQDSYSVIRQGTAIVIDERSIERNDLYFCPALRTVKSRRVGTAGPSRFAWVDFDRPLGEVEAQLDWLARGCGGVMVVHSGSGGGHIYVPLSQSATVSDLVETNRLLAAWLNADSKWQDNSLLRLPDTLNHKSRVLRGVSPTSVHAAVLSNGDESLAGADPAALRTTLLPSAPSRPTRTGTPSPSRTTLQSETPLSPEVSEAFSPPPHLRRLIDEEARLNGRSEQTYKLVCACVEWGCTDGQVLWAALQHKPSASKYGDSQHRFTTELGKVIGKARKKHDHPGLNCHTARCANAATKRTARRTGNPRRGTRR